MQGLAGRDPLKTKVSASGLLDAFPVKSGARSDPAIGTGNAMDLTCPSEILTDAASRAITEA